jgi:vitamin B12 transporter
MSGQLSKLLGQTPWVFALFFLGSSSAIAQNIPKIQDLPRAETTAQALLANDPIAQQPTPEPEEEIVITGKKEAKTATPKYTVKKADIEQRGARSASEVLKSQPGFAINDTGFGADIHTGTSYRGHSLNQSTFLLNGRPIGSNVNTYHGNTDLNTIPTESIDRIELSSGSSATLYGSESFGGVVNIITKSGSKVPKTDASLQFGSYGQSNYRGSSQGGLGNLDYVFSYENFKADNDYAVPLGAANRGTDGRLFNSDVKTTNYFGKLGLDLNPQNRLSLDVSTITSRKGLIYFGFPFQRDRLDHDAYNIGLNLKSAFSKDSVLNTTIGFNKDYFHTYGPTGATAFREGRLNSRALTVRLDHDWKLAPNSQLRWGLDLKNAYLNSESTSTNPAVLRFNESQDRSRLSTALFALNTMKFGKDLQVELGLRQNLNENFGSSLNPSLGLRWEASRQIALRGSWVSVKRLPGLDQQYAYDTVHGWFANEDLKAERGSSWTLGTDLNLGGTLTGQFSYFGSRLRDRIATQPTLLNGRTVSQWQNIGVVNTNGLEMGLNWQMTPQWRTFATYTYTNAKIGDGADEGLQLSQIPFSVAQLGVGYDHKGWQLSLFANYFSGARRAFFVNPGESSREFSPSWVNLDVTARVPIVQGIGLTLAVENIGGKTYEKTNRIYQPGTTFRLGLKSDF